MRPRLTPEERAARRKERSRYSFSNAAYTHYDPKTEGYGYFEQWAKNAEELLNGMGIAKPQRRTTQLDKDLATLYLESLPETAAGLKTAFRNTLKLVHPDVGGSNEATVEAIQAFERLSKHY